MSQAPLTIYHTMFQQTNISREIKVHYTITTSQQKSLFDQLPDHHLRLLLRALNQVWWFVSFEDKLPL